MRNLLSTFYPLPSSRRGGFTLIEILIVVIILGIASAIIVPQLNSEPDLRVAASARIVMADLLYAQNMAISTQGNPKGQSSPVTNPYVFVSFNVSSQQYGVYYFNNANSTLTALTHPVNLNSYVMTFGTTGENDAGNVTLTSANIASGTTTIAFDALGAPYSYNSSTMAVTPLSATAVVTLSASAGSNTYTSTVSIAPNTGEITSP
jgi:prepilin-type N-terminal cleavage/methylation domain-containing protein